MQKKKHTIAKILLAAAAAGTAAAIIKKLKEQAEEENKEISEVAIEAIDRALSGRKEEENIGSIDLNDIEEENQEDNQTLTAKQ